VPRRRVRRADVSRPRASLVPSLELARRSPHEGDIPVRNAACAALVPRAHRRGIRAAQAAAHATWDWNAPPTAATPTELLRGPRRSFLPLRRRPRSPAHATNSPGASCSGRLGFDRCQRGDHASYDHCARPVVSGSSCCACRRFEVRRASTRRAGAERRRGRHRQTLRMRRELGRRRSRRAVSQGEAGKIDRQDLEIAPAHALGFSPGRPRRRRRSPTLRPRGKLSEHLSRRQILGIEAGASTSISCRRSGRPHPPSRRSMRRARKREEWERGEETSGHQTRCFCRFLSNFSPRAREDSNLRPTAWEQCRSVGNNGYIRELLGLRFASLRRVLAPFAPFGASKMHPESRVMRRPEMNAAQLSADPEGDLPDADGRTLPGGGSACARFFRLTGRCRAR
jgi:hypothetical protein